MITEEKIENGVLITHITYEESDYYTQQEKNDIYEICKACQFKVNETCSVVSCSCLLDALISLKTNHCPLEKW